jgi:hypothetical protein
MGGINEILEGWGNLILRPEQHSELVKRRLIVCDACPVRSGVFCDSLKGGCGCVIPAKVRVENTKCPKGNW